MALFVHMFQNYSDKQNCDRGWWEYDPASNHIYDENHQNYGECIQHPKNEFIESDWDTIFKTKILDSSLPTGWIAPDGTFYGCAPFTHARLLNYLFNFKDSEQAELAGWVRLQEFCITSQNQRTIPSDECIAVVAPYGITTKQAYTLLKKGYSIDPSMLR